MGNDDDGMYDDDHTHDNDDGFLDYEVSTIDPGKEALMVTTVISILMVLLIPFFIAVREQIRASRKRRKWKKAKRKKQQMKEKRMALLEAYPSLKTRDMSELYIRSSAVETQAVQTELSEALEDSILTVVRHDHTDMEREAEFSEEEDEIKKIIPVDLLDDEEQSLTSTTSSGEESSGTYGVEREDTAVAEAYGSADDNQTANDEVVIDVKDFLKGPSKAKVVGRRMGATSQIIRNILQRRHGKKRFGLKKKNNNEEATVATTGSDEEDFFGFNEDEEIDVWEDELLEAYALEERNTSKDPGTDYHGMENSNLPTDGKIDSGYVQMEDKDDKKIVPEETEVLPVIGELEESKPPETFRQPSIAELQSIETALSQSAPTNDGDYVMMQHQRSSSPSLISRLKRKPSRTIKTSFVQISTIGGGEADKVEDAAAVHDHGPPSENSQKDCFPDKAPSSSSEENDTDEPTYEKRVNVDVCCGPKPWWSFLCSKHFWHKVAKCASYDHEMKALLKLALPFTVHTIFDNILGLCEIAVIGRLLGTPELSAYYTVDFVFSLCTMFLEGFHSSLYTLCSHAVGAEKYHLAGQYIQLSVIFYEILLIPCAFIWWWWLDDVIYWLGFDEDVVDISVNYAMIAVWMYFLGAIDESVYSLLEICGYELYTSIIGIVGSAASFILVLLYALYSTEPTLRGIGILHLSLQIAFMVFNFALIISSGWLDEYWGGMVFSFAPKNWRVVKAFLKTSTPLAFGYIMAYGEWEVLFVFAGLMGPAEVAVWGLLGTIWESIEDVGLATADAAEVRVANLLGSNQPKRARYSSHKALFVGVVFSLLFTIPVFVLRERLPSWFTKDETLQSLFAELIPYICIGNVTMMFGSMSWTLLGAQGRFGLATLVGFIGSWGLTLPLSAISTLVMNFDLQAMTGAVVIGYACSGSINSYFLLRSNWEKLAKKVQKRNREAEENPLRHGKYDTYYWKNLPPDVKQAAKLLGFTKRIWNNDKEPDTYVLPFSELDIEQQKAALLVGFTRRTWGIAGEEEEEDYEEYDWDELPAGVKEAAIVLGYDKEMWDNETGEPFSSDCAWDELTPAQQDAAALLGYGTEEEWNGD